MGIRIIQIGVKGEKKLTKDFRTNLPLKKLKRMAKKCDGWIAVDNFFPHLCWSIGVPGIAIFGKSDPNIFGHKENTNILKSRKYLRKKPFDVWEVELFDKKVFVKPEIIRQKLYEQKEGKI